MTDSKLSPFFEQCTGYTDVDLAAEFWMDAGIDIYFIIDIAVNFRTAYFAQDGSLITNRRMVSMR